MTRNATHFNNPGKKNYILLHLQCSTRLSFKKELDLVISGGFPIFLLDNKRM